MAKNNKLFDLVPEAKAYYNSVKNKDIDASALTIGSKQKVWWMCPNCGAETYQSVSSKVKKFPDGSYHFKGCQNHCNNNLFDLIPEAKAYYDFDKNTDIDASALTVGSQQEVWWKCPDCGDETYQRINNKARKLSDGSYHFYDCKCHYHQRRSIKGSQPTISETECLSRIWNSENNSALDPSILFVNSKVRANWVCPKCGHTWCAPVCRVYDTSGRCPACEGRNIIVPGHNDVMTLAPDAKRYYNWDKNAGIDIEHLGVSSSTEVWWRCPDCGNEIKMPIKNKIKKQSDGSYRVRSCNKCFGKSREKQTKAASRFVAESENLMRFWNVDVNKGLDPATLSINSKKDASWKCQKCGYTWASKINYMRRASGKCPSCDKSYVSENENLMKFWDWDGNKEIDPATLSAFSRQAVSWKCQKCGYTWTSIVHSLRNSKGECPCCDQRRVIVVGINDVFTLVPEAKDYYDFEKNADIDITTVNLSSKQRVWWKCPTCGNETFSSFASKIRKIDGAYHFAACQKCYRNGGNVQRKTANGAADMGARSLAARCPDIANLWSENNERAATTVTPVATFDALWVCQDCHLEYRALVQDMVNGNASCPVCSNKRLQPGYNTLADKSPDIAKLWSPSNRLRPIDVFPTSAPPVRWSCPDCGGEYNAPVKDMVNGTAECPYCADRRPLSGHNTLADKYPVLAAMWSADNGRGADSILPDSPYEARWVCSDCGGEFDAPIRDMVNGTAECPYCADKKVLPGFNSFAAKHPELLKEWNYVHNYAIDINPDAISDKTESAAWWICEHGHKYKMRVCRRVMFEKRDKIACPICKGRRREVQHFI